MIDKTNPNYVPPPEEKKGMEEAVFELIKLTRGIIALILDLGPVPTEKIFGKFVEKGMKPDTAEKLLVLCEATGRVKRDGLVLRPTSPKEQAEHDRIMIATIIKLQKEAQERGNKA